jgi:hypothetical protein
MISPVNQKISGGEAANYDVSCFEDSYVSDDDLSVEQSAQTSKRQKMTEVERLTRWYVKASLFDRYEIETQY